MKNRHRRARGRRRRTRATSAFVRHRLGNGTTLVLCPRPHLAHAHAAVFFGVGSRHETEEDNGITHVLEHMVFRGTRRFKDATALNAAAEDIGGFLDGATYRDHLTFSTNCHPTAVGQAIHILSELVASPRYRSMEVERSILREELLETLDMSGRMIDLDNIAHRAAFGPTGLGLPIEGTLENLDDIDTRALEAHRNRFLVGRNCVVAVAGPLEPERVLDQVRRAFGALPAGEPPDFEPAAAPPEQPVLRYVRDAASQVDIRVSFPAVPVTDSEYPVLTLLARILADGLASRMHAELVDRRGLAYVLHAGLTTYADCGLFEFDISVSPNKAARAVESLLRFAESAGRFRFTPEELRRARRRYRYGMEFMDDSPADLVHYYGRAALFGVEREMAAMQRRLARVEAADLRRAARDVFQRDGLVVAAVGEIARGQWREIRSIVDDWRR